MTNKHATKFPDNKEATTEKCRSVVLFVANCLSEVFLYCT